MRLSVNLLSFTLATVLGHTIHANTIRQDAGLPSSQDLAGAVFSGRATSPNPMSPKTRYAPYAETLHLDSGNTRSEDELGPLGLNITQTSWPVPKSPFFWDSTGSSLTSIALCGTRACIAALDPHSLSTIASWSPPNNQTLQITYLQVRGTSVIAPTAEGRLYVVDRETQANGTITFQTTRQMDVSAHIPAGQTVLGAAWDAAGNVWFATGGIVGVDDAGANGTTVGYVAADDGGSVHTVSIDNQVAENNMAVSGETVYMSTGPAGADDHAGAVGYLLGFQAAADGERGAVRTVFNESYEAGSGLKPGAFARGSGSSPGLVGDAYIAVTDNADGRIRLNVYKQVQSGYVLDGQNMVCSLPLFGVNASANDNALVTHWDGETGEASIVVTNTFHQPTMLNLRDGLPADINDAAWNDLTVMPGEFLSVAVVPEGNGTRCEVVWEKKEFYQTSIPILSTAAGLLYTYALDGELAKEGSWVWYWVALDARTGIERWRVRAGAGGTYNNNGMLPYLGPDGALWIATVAGTVKLQDKA
ncbi:hypothetical protein DIS24_g10452 [Lasiodiplodia hormozganensis]|uniref:Uncharacterized protein n=1 Tax=Lasiodiplodia hormozganensis TaxID=869390 RepID=A0AA40CGV2_9PEZI|nr:hypothetical protein DIS24_g10452 [Lasiodiplodia hormozganensis]